MGNFISVQQEETPVLCDIQKTNQSVQVEEEPLNLLALPEDLTHSIVKKLNYRDYARLEETSKAVANVLNNGDFSLTHPVQMVYVNKKTTKMNRISGFDIWDSIRLVPWHVATNTVARIHAETVDIRCRASSNRMKAVAKLFEKNKTTAECIQIREHITFEPEDLGLLIKVLQPSKINCLPFLPRKFFINHDSGLLKLEHLSCHHTGCTDEELFSLKNIPCIYLGGNDFITDAALNKFLKEWKKGKIEMGSDIYFGMAFDTTAGTRNFDRILEGLNANPIWTPALHEQSLVAAINLQDFQPMEQQYPPHFYSLWDSNSPEKIWKLELRQDHVDLEPFSREAWDCFATNETSLILRRLNDDQYYLVTKTCDGCGTEFCCHRRWYSTQRLKRIFPRVYGILIGGIMFATKVLLTARCVQLLGGSGHFRNLLTDDVKRIHFEEEADRSLFKTAMYILRVYLLHQ